MIFYYFRTFYFYEGQLRYVLQSLWFCVELTLQRKKKLRAMTLRGVNLLLKTQALF